MRKFGGPFQRVYSDSMGEFRAGKKLLWTIDEALEELSMSRWQFKREVMPFVAPVITPAQVAMKRPTKRDRPEALEKFILGCPGGDAGVDPESTAREKVLQKLHARRAEAERRRAKAVSTTSTFQTR